MIQITITILVAIFFLIWTVKWFYMKHKYYDTGLHKYKGPVSIPLIGHAWIALVVDATGFLDYTTKICQQYNDTVVLYTALTPGIITTDYNLIELIMNGNVQTKKATTYNFMLRWLSTGLLISYGEKWRKRRKMITPAFHFQILEQFVDVFHEAGDILVEQLAKEIDDDKEKNVNIYDFISLSTLDVICETAMGTKINAQIIKDSKYISSVKFMGHLFLKRMCSPLHNFDFTYHLTPDFKKETECLKILHGHTKSIITARRKELSDLGKANTTNEVSEEIGMKKKYAFLDMLLQSTIDGKPLTDEDIREEVDTFMFEGHDTTAAAISFALYLIAKYEDVQAKILAEQCVLFEKNRSRPASYNDLNDMKYLELVIKETLRLYPSVPGMGREVLEDFEFDGMNFKKGMNIGILAYGIHRNPKYFPDPEVFNPERFSKDNYLGKYPYAYIPFAAGNRNCIGQRFAMLEMKATISKVVRFFELYPVVPEHKLQLVPETILRCLNGVPIIIKSREIF